MHRSHQKRLQTTTRGLTVTPPERISVRANGTLVFEADLSAPVLSDRSRLSRIRTVALMQSLPAEHRDRGLILGQDRDC